MWTAVDETGRITCTTPYEKYADESMIDYDIFPDDFNFGTQNDYRIVDGELVYDPLPEPPESQIAKLKGKLAETNDTVLEMYEAMVLGKELDDETAAEYAQVMVDRESWKQQIAELEAQIDAEKDETTDREEVSL